MNPQLRVTLCKIGWEVVEKASPLYAFSLAAQLGTELVGTDADARRHAELLEDLMRKAFEVMRELEDLPEEVRWHANMAASELDEIADGTDGGRPQPKDITGETAASLWRLMRGLEATEAKLRSKGGPPRRGNKRNLAPYTVARVVAEIYFIGLGELPKAYNESTGKGVGGLYGSTLEEVFDILGLGVDAKGPAKDAVRKLSSLSDDEQLCLLAKRCPITREMVSVTFEKGF